MADKKPMQLTCAVEDATIATMARLKAGDHAKVRYVEMGEKRIIKSIVKA